MNFIVIAERQAQPPRTGERANDCDLREENCGSNLVVERLGVGCSTLFDCMG